jgi:putative SOS response-associated peptidase YedK
MCGRFTRFKSWREVHEGLSAFLDALDAPNDYATSYNVAPTQMVLAITSRGGRHRATMMRWGLVPYWTSEIPKVAMFNARAETVAEKPAFREGWRQGRRCLVIADGYYEWHTQGGVKQPYRIHLPGVAVFGFAGLWAHNDNLDITSCTILTTDAAPSIGHLHPRMPVIIRHHAMRDWLDPGTAPDEARRAVAGAYGVELAAYPVGRAVGNVGNDEPALIEPAA